MLESIVVKREILQLEPTLFESNPVYAKAKNHVQAETICQDWIAPSERKNLETLFFPDTTH